MVNSVIVVKPIPRQALDVQRSKEHIVDNFSGHRPTVAITPTYVANI
jgi:hypothetical protein